MLVRAAERAERTGAPGRAAANYASAAELLVLGISARGWSQKQANVPCARQRCGSGRPVPTRLTPTSTVRSRTPTRPGCCYLDDGDDRGAARAQTLAGRALGLAGRFTEARALLSEALAVLQQDPDVDTVATLGALADVEILTAGPRRSGWQPRHWPWRRRWRLIRRWWRSCSSRVALQTPAPTGRQRQLRVMPKRRALPSRLAMKDDSAGPSPTCLMRWAGLTPVGRPKQHERRQNTLAISVHGVFLVSPP